MAPSATETDKPGGLTELSREFQSAVIAHDLAGAERLLASYTAALEELSASVPAPELAASEEAARAMELMVWARQMVLIQRALAQGQLAALQKTGHYRFKTVAPALDIQA